MWPLTRRQQARLKIDKACQGTAVKDTKATYDKSYKSVQRHNEKYEHNEKNGKNKEKESHRTGGRTGAIPRQVLNLK